MVAPWQAVVQTAGTKRSIAQTRSNEPYNLLSANVYKLYRIWRGDPWLPSRAMIESLP
jgi:hypothetical protein